jgi:RimJ/RimL family protein N-acetyltransferase
MNQRIEVDTLMKVKFRRTQINAMNEQSTGTFPWMEAGFQKLADNIIDGIYCINTDGYFIFMNKALSQRTGIRHEQYPVDEERKATLKNGAGVVIRPSRASDAEMLQDLFYSLKKEDVYTRFFRRLSALPVSQAELFCNVDYENKMAFMAIVGDRENEEIVGSSIYVVDETTNMGEVAFMIRSEWQSAGLGTVLQNRMVEYAKLKGLRGFTGQILVENKKMLRLIYQISENVTSTSSQGVCEVTALF